MPDTNPTRDVGSASRSFLAPLLLLLAVALAVVVVRNPSTSPADSAARLQVVDAQSGETLRGSTAEVIADSDQVLDQPRLVEVSAPGHRSRVVAQAPDSSPRVPLVKDDDSSLSLRFGGDVSAGGGDDSALDEVKPLFEDADLGVANLETPLVKRPGEAAHGSPRFHRSRETVHANPPVTATNLRTSGIDVVSLANDHVYDAFDAGVRSTLRTLDGADVVHVGAGMNEDQAWQPAFTESRGQTVAFLGCTTVDGDDHPRDFVASDDKAGAAECDEDRLRESVGAAAKKADAVVTMIHAGDTGERVPSDEAAELTEIAADAGASTVVNTHPGVPGAVGERHGAAVVDSLGQLASSDTTQAGLRSGIARVDLHKGRAVATAVDPVLRQGVRPVPVLGEVAEDVRSLTAGRNPQQRDLLWGTGSMEDVETSEDNDGPPLWELGRYAEASNEAACNGGQGLQMRRSPVSDEDVIVTTTHRREVRAGQKLTLEADVGMASPGATLELNAYTGSTGPSLATRTVEIPQRGPGDDCSTVQLDYTVPKGVQAVQPYLRLTPPDDSNLVSELRVDDVRLLRN